MKIRSLLIYLFLCLSLFAYGEEAKDSIWNGLNLRIDLGTPILEAVMSRGKVQSYEMMLNANLCHRFFPTIEMGYAQASASTERGQFRGLGGFGRIGLDISALKKHRESDNKLLVGLRVGTAVQQHSYSGLYLPNDYWGKDVTIDYPERVRCDAWGEVVAGVQVKVYKHFHMGWSVRLKILMTRKENKLTAYYIPGFGYRQDTNFGLNYYLGWTF